MSFLGGALLNLLLQSGVSNLRAEHLIQQAQLSASRAVGREVVGQTVKTGRQFLKTGIGGGGKQKRDLPGFFDATKDPLRARVERKRQTAEEKAEAASFLGQLFHPDLLLGRASRAFAEANAPPLRGPSRLSIFDAGAPRKRRTRRQRRKVQRRTNREARTKRQSRRMPHASKRARRSTLDKHHELLESNFIIDNGATVVPGTYTASIVPWEVSTAGTGAGVTRTLLSSVAQGDNKNERTGRVIHVKKVQFRLAFRMDTMLNFSDGSILPAEIRVRCVCVAWHHAAGLSLDDIGTDVFDTTVADTFDGGSHLLAFRRTDQTGNYRVLYDKTKAIMLEQGGIVHDLQSTAADETLGVRVKEALFTANLDVPDAIQDVRFNGSGANAAAHAQRAFAMFYFIDDAVMVNTGFPTNTYSVRGNCRVRYTG